MSLRHVVALPSKSLRAVVHDIRPLTFPSPFVVGGDRLPHVRAASGMVWVGERIVICQDDAHFLVNMDPQAWKFDLLELPPGPGGTRLFSEASGNKQHKMDLESSVYLADRDLYLAFGSGSKPARFRIVLVEGLTKKAPQIKVVDADTFYRMLARQVEFAGSEMNIEGAAIVGGTLRIFQRGNGAARGELLPVNATGDIRLDAMLAYLESGGKSNPPAIENIVQYDLGRSTGVKLTFTDATAAGNAMYYVAAAEDSPDTYRDGPVTGTAIGRLGDGSAEFAFLRRTDGTPFTGKVEGLLFDRGSSTTGYLATDHDDPDVPSELCRFEISEK